MKYDYHNAKALVKGAAVKVGTLTIADGGRAVSAAQVKEAFSGTAYGVH